MGADCLRPCSPPNFKALIQQYLKTSLCLKNKKGVNLLLICCDLTLFLYILFICLFMHILLILMFTLAVFVILVK